MKLLLPLFLALGVIGCQSTDNAPSVARADEPLHGSDAPLAVHGMLMMGSGPVYLSHLPMFHSPHDYQVLMEVELSKPQIDATQFYAEDRRVTGEKIYTLVPEPFALAELFTPPNQPWRQTFKAQVVRGHFERGGVPILSGVTVTVRRVVYAHLLEANSPALSELQYLVFGNQTELFAAHTVSRKPDFDHIVSIRLNAGVLTDGQAAAIRKGARLVFPTQENKVQQALKESQTFEGQIQLPGGPLLINGTTTTELYLETGDLAF